jgi:hypothetical protein
MNQNHDELRSYSSKSKWFTLKYPDTWGFEISEECTSFFRKTSGYGVLQVSSYRTVVHESAESNLREYLEDEGIESNVDFMIQQDGQQMAFSEFKNDDGFTKVWFIVGNNILLFITYMCDVVDIGKEDPDINIIVSSVQVCAI